jgi:hypothetical protein
MVRFMARLHVSDWSRAKIRVWFDWFLLLGLGLMLRLGQGLGYGKLGLYLMLG